MKPIVRPRFFLDFLRVVALFLVLSLVSSNSLPAQSSPGAWQFAPAATQTLPLEPYREPTTLNFTQANSSFPGAITDLQVQGAGRVLPDGILLKSVNASNGPGFTQTMALTGTGSQVDAVTPELRKIAETLNKDADKIYEYVLNNISYEHYYGCKKGAQLTLLEGSGNDMDQCALLAALLRAAGHEARYVQQWQLIPYDANCGPYVNASAEYVASGISWLGLADSTLSTMSNIPTAPQGWDPVAWRKSNLLLRYFANSGFPVEEDVPVFQGCLAVQRMVLEVKVPFGGGGTLTTTVDPSRKLMQKKDPLNFGGLSDFNISNFLNAVGGTLNGDSVRSLSVSAAAEQLSARATALTTGLRNHGRANDTVQEALGLGEAIFYPARLGNSLALWFGTTSEPFDTIPDNLISKVSFQIAPYSVGGSAANAAKYTIPLPVLQGKPLTLTSSGDTVELRLDDELLPANFPGIGTDKYFLRTSIEHPYYFKGEDVPFVENVYKKNDTYAYALLYGYKTSKKQLDMRLRVLNDLYKEAKNRFPEAFSTDGAADFSKIPASETVLRRKLRTEPLNAMGMSWMYQTSQAGQLVAGVNNMNLSMWHRFGRMAQEDGFYIDVGLQFTGLFPRDGNSARTLSSSVTWSYIASALEHGIIDQYNGKTDESLSTMQIFQRAAKQTAAEKTTILRAYKNGSNTNWNQIKGQLDSQYNKTVLDKIFSDNTYVELFIPQYIQAGETGWSWKGSGYVVVSRKTENSTSYVGMVITGDYGTLSGGYSPRIEQLSVPPIIRPLTTDTRAYELGKLVVGMLTLGLYSPITGADPVDMMTGAFTYEETDLALGLNGVRGLSFERNYNSHRGEMNDVRLGYGWTHNYAMKAMTRTAAEAGLGETTVYDSAPMLAAIAMISELVYNTSDTPSDLRRMSAAALVAKAAVDNLLENAVTVSMGNESLQFTKQPDGTYMPPAGSIHSLAKSGDLFVLQERLGNTYRFDTTKGGRITEVQDPYQKKLTFTYNGTTGALDKVTDAYSRSLTFTYTNDLITKVSDSTGRMVVFGYDANRNLVTTQDVENSSANVTRFEYDGSHRIVVQKDPLGRTVLRNIYNDDGQVVEQRIDDNSNKAWKMTFSGLSSTEKDPLGHTKTYYYSRSGQPSGYRDPWGACTVLRYDGQGHLIEQKTPKANFEDGWDTATWEYNSDQNISKMVDSLQTVTTYSYDGQKRLVKTVVTPLAGRGEPRTSRLEYDTPYLQPSRVIDGRGKTTSITYRSDGTVQTTKAPGESMVITYDYDSYGMPKKITYPGGTYTETEYNVRGEKIAEKDALLQQTSYECNNRGQLKKIIRPGGVISEMRYDACGNPVWTKSSRNVISTFEYSTAGKLLRESAAVGTPDEATVQHRYANNEWRIATIDPLGRETQFTYDALGRVVSMKDPLGNISKSDFDIWGNLRVSQTPQGHTSFFTYNSQGAVTESTDPAGETTQSSYNGFGERISLKNRRNNTYTFAYDDNGNPRRITTPTGKSAVTEWNDRNLVSSHTKAGSGVTNYFYDALGRLKTLTDTVGSISFGYDANGNSRSVDEGAANLVRTWDALDRPISYKNAAGETIEYGYDDGGLLTRLTYPGNKTVTYAYTSRGQLKSVKDWVNRETTYTWDKAGQLLKVTRPNGTTRTNIYDEIGRLTSYQERNVRGDLLAYAAFLYDKDGNLVSRYRLPNPQMVQQPLLSAAYDADNRVTLFAGTTVSHDADGNMLSGPLGSPVNMAYTYDARNRLISVGGANYTYDAENNRILQRDSLGQTLRYTVDPHGDALPRVLVRTKQDGSKTYYIYGVGLAYELNESSETVRYYHFDNTGNTVALSDAGGSVTDRMEYGVYGHLSHRSGTTDTPYLHVGQLGVETDGNGLLYMRARYYNPYLMRFINADPAGFDGGQNWYAYAGNNPLQLVDPSGLAPGTLGGDFFTAIGTITPYIPVFGNIMQGYYELGKGNDAAAVMHLVMAGVEVYGIGKMVTAVAATTQVATTASRTAAMTSQRAVTNAVSRPVSSVATQRVGTNVASNTVPKAIPGACFVAGTPITIEAGGCLIETLKVGDRVLTSDQNARTTEVDPDTWRKITLKMPNPEYPSNIFDLELLRSEEWIQEVGCAKDAHIWFNLDEMGLHGWADVVAVEPCPPIQSGRGRVVLATVTHINSSVMEIHLAGVAEVLQPTDRHRLFSATRNDWIPAGQLAVGEELATNAGTVLIESITAKIGMHRVYNIEVETEHCFYAGAAQVLSHNNNPCAMALGSKPPSFTPPDAGRNGALRAALRNEGVPTSQQPSRVLPNYDRRGKLQPGRVYEYDIPAPGGGKRTVRIRDDVGGHNYGPGDPQNRGRHFNDSNGNHYDY